MKIKPDIILAKIKSCENKNYWHYNLIGREITVVKFSVGEASGYIPVEFIKENGSTVDQFPVIPEEDIEILGVKDKSFTPVRPEHYGGEQNPFEPIKIISYYNMNFYLGSVLKYIVRAGKKNNEPELQDLKKAAFYLDKHIKDLENKK